MGTKLNKRFVDSLASEAKRYDKFDSDVSGFHIRVTPAGSKVYRLKYILFGRQRVMKIGEHGKPWTTENARREAERLRGLVVSGTDPQTLKEERARAEEAKSIKGLTVEGLTKQWILEGPYSNPSKKAASWKTDESALVRHIVPLIGKREVKSLTKQDIEWVQRQISIGATARDEKIGFRSRLIVRGGPGIARRATAAFSACLSWAMDRGEITTNPCARVKKAPQKKLERFLSQEEAVTLFETIDQMQARGALYDAFADLFRLLLLTGARKSEIQYLRWDEIDLNRRMIVLPPERSKTGKKAIALSASAAALIDARPRTSAYVLPSERLEDRAIEGVQKAWQRTRREAGLENVRLHDLRHSFASFAAASGASLVLIGKALGHSQTSTTARYAHLTDDPVRELADVVGNMARFNGE